MDSFCPSSFDICEIYRKYCDITLGMPAAVGDCCMPDDESQKLRLTREAISQLLEVVESKLNTRVSILEEAYKLMLRIGLMANFSEFSGFYDFVFFICRENGRRNISKLISLAVMAWRLVLAGRFRLLDQWCNFIGIEESARLQEKVLRQLADGDGLFRGGCKPYMYRKI